MPKLLVLALLWWGSAACAASAAAFEDTIGQRTLACTACHGKEGRAGPDGYYPRIAGKPVGYLYNQLLNFREGRRHYGLMTRLIDPLSNEYLLEIAHHFASLDLPYAPPPPAAAPAEVLDLGRELAFNGVAERRLPACVQCHGRALTGMQPATPGLLGLPRDYLNAQLGAWRTGQRRAHAPDCMGEVARALTPEELSAVTAWLAAQPLPRDPKPGRAQPRTNGIACGSAYAAPEEPKPQKPATQRKRKSRR